MLRYILTIIFLVCLVGAGAAQISTKVPGDTKKEITVTLEKMDTADKSFKDIKEENVTSTEMLRVKFSKKGASDMANLIQIAPYAAYNFFPDFSYRSLTWTKSYGNKYEGYTGYEKGKYEPWEYYFKTITVSPTDNYVKFLLADHVGRQAWILETSYDAFNEAVISPVAVGKMPDMNLLKSLGRGVCDRCAERS